jgi:glycosyltransferase involved in cell wall biosynthesis
MSELPYVSCVMSAYNAEPFVAAALDSVLSQDYPPELLELVVVDDGSTDATAEVIRGVQARSGERVRLIQQRNAGNAAAVAVANANAKGSLLAICDADDEWLPGKVAEQAAIFAAHPDVALVYGDMQVIDAEGAVLEPSFFAKYEIEPLRGAILDQLVGWNFTTNSTLMYRACDLVPMPDNFPTADYWLVAHAAAAGTAEAIERPLASYRLHASNRGFGAEGEAYVRKLKRELLARRLILASVFESVSLDTLVATVAELYAKGAWTARIGQRTTAEIFDITEADRVRAAAELERGRAAATLDDRVRATAAAVIHDPVDAEARTALRQATTWRAQAGATAGLGAGAGRARASVVIPAFNLATYLPSAIDSALAQQPPGGAVQVIVVDDGSTDATPEVLARYGDRIRVLRQRNGGLVAAVDAGLAIAEGEYIALLDADDEWPSDRLVRHTAALDANPALGLVQSDMEVIDAGGAVLHSSFFASKELTPASGRALGQLLAGNSVSGGSATFRASLLPALHPIATDAAYPDWWLAACIAAVAEIGVVPGIGNRYRYHGANMGLGSGIEDQPKIQRNEIPWRRWMLWHLIDDETVTARDVEAALRSWRFGLLAAATAEPAGARALLEIDREGAELALRAAPPAGAGGRPVASKALLRALTRDPFDGAIAVDLEVALAREAQLPVVDPPPPLATLTTRPRLTVAWLEEVLATPALLHEFGARAGEDETLAVLAPPGADLAGLIALVETDPRLSGEGCDITVLAEPATTPARALLASRARARLSAATSPAPYDGVAVHEAVERARLPVTR